MIKRLIAILAAVLMGITAVSAAFGETCEILRRGDSGEQVKHIQMRLAELGYLDGECTGNFDEATEEALRRFQREHNLLQTGMADETTCRVLDETTEKASVNAGEEEDGDWWAGAVYAGASAKNAMTVEEACYDAAYEYPAETYPDLWGIPFTTDEYNRIESNRFLSTQTSPLSTFAADVDTSSYAQLRRRILNGETVPADSVRIEELLNYFRYDYRQFDQ